MLIVLFAAGRQQTNLIAVSRDMENRLRLIVNKASQDERDILFINLVYNFIHPEFCGLFRPEVSNFVHLNFKYSRMI